MSFKAKLKVVLQADDTIVAESSDAILWQKVLMAINSGASDSVSIDQRSTSPLNNDHKLDSSGNKAIDPIERFARQLGLPREEVEGACSPQTAEPYMHLDPHCWEAMKKQTGERGPNAYSPIAVASTLLALWFKVADLGNVTQAQAQSVLGTIGVRDQNSARGIERSEWLQGRPGGTVIVNPAKTSRATEVATSFCSKKWTKATE